MVKKNKTITDIKLTITMLVSNRIKTIRKCMDSINPILQKVSSELIVVDTGSTDGSIDIVREYTDKIVTFSWCDDFSAARNAGLEKAQGEWVMFLDDDEWFEDVTEIIDFFNTGEYKKYNRGVYIARNYGDFGGTTWSDSNATRMVKRYPTTKFIGMIHEYLWPQVEPTKYFESYVHHYGYVHTTEAENREHSKRNISLIEKELKLEPNNFRLRVQAIQEYYGIREFRKTLELCQSVMNDYEMDNEIKIFAGYACNYMLRTYIAMEEWEKGYEYGNDLLLNGVPTAISLMGNVREMIKICRMSKRYKEGIRCVKKYLESFDVLSKEINKEEIYLDLSRYLQASERELVYQEGIALGILGEDEELVDTCFRSMNWDKSPFSLYPDTLDYIIEYLSYIEFEEIHNEVWKKLCIKELFVPQIEKNIQKYRESEEKYEKLLSLFEYNMHDSWFIKKYRFYYHMLYVKKWSKESAEDELSNLLEKTANPLLIEDDLWDIIKNNDLSLEKVIYNISHIRWLHIVREWMELGLKKQVDIDRIYEFLHIEEKQDIRSQFVKLKYKEYQICRNNSKEIDNNILSDIEEYSTLSMAYFSKIYNSFVFEEENITMLPPEGLFAFYITKALEQKKQGDISSYCKLLVKAGQAHPGMREYCKELLKEEQKRYKYIKEEKKEENEFELLASQIKEKIRGLIKEENFEPARLFIANLEQLLPMDEEVQELKKLIN